VEDKLHLGDQEWAAGEPKQVRLDSEARSIHSLDATNKPDISVFFPVYNDEHTVERVTRKALDVLSQIASEYEVLIVDDGTPCRAGEIADALARENPRVRVIHHPKNLGYGAAVRTGLANVRYDWVCFTDGDDEYDIYDLQKLIRLKDYYDLIVTFRYTKMYSGFRVFISWVYNASLRFLFKTRYRDISTGLRLIRRELIDDQDDVEGLPRRRSWNTDLSPGIRAWLHYVDAQYHSHNERHASSARDYLLDRL
jgi:glycosyltransferase involved in cell wall biosynthesis